MEQAIVIVRTNDMNERIKELAEQALFESDFDDEQNIKITMDIFAELIVKECVYVSEGYFGFKDHTPGTAIANEIKQHFGVEE